MQPLIRRELDGLVAVIAHSTRADGDLSPADVDDTELASRRQVLVPRPWRALHQVHSDRVVTAFGAQDSTSARPVADALVTTEVDLVLAAHSGDCVPVGFVSTGGAVATAHAGWKGLERGVLESTVRALRAAAQPAALPEIVAVVGPHIRAESYEFGQTDLHRLATRFGPVVSATTQTGAAALDLTAAVDAELARLGVVVQARSTACTARDASDYWSHRARGETGRIALFAWLESAWLEPS